MDFEFDGIHRILAARPRLTAALHHQMKAETPTADDLKKWETLGGKQVMEKKRAVFIAPSGKIILGCFYVVNESVRACK